MCLLCVGRRTFIPQYLIGLQVLHVLHLVSDNSGKYSSEESSNEITVKGRQPTMYQRSKPDSRPSSLKSPKSSRKGPKKSKARNYNIREDENG